MMTAEEAKVLTLNTKLKNLDVVINAAASIGQFYVIAPHELTEPEVKVLEDNGYQVAQEGNKWIICWNV